MGVLARFYRRDSRSLARIPRADGSLLGLSGMGYGRHGGRWVAPGGMGGPLDRAQQAEWCPGIPMDQFMADALLETNAVARRIAEREPQDCTREGYDLVGLDPGVADAVEAYTEGGDHSGLNLLSSLMQARIAARAYGGGALVLLVDDGRSPHEPIDRANIRAVRGVLAADRWDMPVSSWDIRGVPLTYRLQRYHGGRATILTVHRDRVVRVRGVPLPQRLSQRRQGWDGSVFDLVFDALRRYGTVLNQSAEAVGLLNQGVLKSPALTAGLEAAEVQDVFLARLEAMRAAMGTYGEMAIGNEEEYAIHNRSLSGIGDAIKASVDALVAAADGMPRLILLGEPTSGLSDTTGGELRMWYDSCAARQPRYYTPAVKSVVDLVMLSHEGPTGGRLIPYDVEWRPLWQIPEAEQAELDLKRAQRRQIDIASTVVSGAQARLGDPSVQELYGPLPAETEPQSMSGEEPGEGPLMGEQSDQVEPEGVITLAPEPPSTARPPADLVSPQEAARAINVTTHWLRRRMRAGDLPYWSFGVEDRVSMADVTALGQRHVALAEEG